MFREAENQLIEVAKDAKTVKDPLYVKMMEQVDLRRRSFKKKQNPSPVLTILAKDISDITKMKRKKSVPY